MKRLRVFLIGFGNVGQKLISMLSIERHLFHGLNELSCDIIGIKSGRHGTIINQNGIDRVEALFQFRNHGRFDSSHPDFSEISYTQCLDLFDIDVVVEVSPLSIENNGEPAIMHVREALQRGIHVVTANKGPAAFAYRELKELTELTGSRFLFESAVMDGAPVFNLARNPLRVARITGLSGIINSTTNFVIECIREGHTTREAFREAQQSGIAEADPSYDLDGWDAAAKLAVMGNVLMDLDITPFDVNRQLFTNDIEEMIGITPPEQVIRQVARIFSLGTGWYASVGFDAFDIGHPFAAVSGYGSALKIETDVMGPLIIQQQAPTIKDTAYGIISDLVEIALHF